MKKLNLKFFLFAVVASTIFSGCRRDKENVGPKDTAAQENSEDYTLAANDFYNIDQDLDDAYQQGGSNARTEEAFCGNLSFTGNTSGTTPGFFGGYKMFSINYAGGNCDSLVRSGNLTIYHQGTIANKNFKDSVVFNGYKIDNRIINGYRVSKINAAQTDENTLAFDIVTNTNISFVDGKSIQWNTKRLRKHINYQTALSYVQVTGSGDLQGKQGGRYTLRIEDPIIIRRSCIRGYRFPVSGKLILSNTTNATSASIDYGNGVCDRLATLKGFNGNTYVYFMR